MHGTAADERAARSGSSQFRQSHFYRHDSPLGFRAERIGINRFSPHYVMDQKDKGSVHAQSR